MTDEKPEIEEGKEDFDSDAPIHPSGGRADVPKPQDPSEDDSTDAVGETGEPKAHT